MHTNIASLTSSYNQKYKTKRALPIWGLNLVLITCISFWLIVNFLTNQSRVLGNSVGLDETVILSLINKQRQLQKLPPLTQNQQLKQAAQNKAKDMLLNHYWDHYSPSQTTPWQFITATGYNYHFAGENLAKDYYSEQSLVADWMASENHRMNILSNNFSETGIAIVEGELDGKESIFIVQLFATAFTPLELENALQKGSIIVQNSPTQPVINRQNPNAMQSAKLALSAVLLASLLFLTFDLKKYYKKNSFNRLVQRYWLSSILLLILTSLLFNVKIISL